MISIGLWQPQVIDAEKWEIWKMVIFHSFLYVYQRVTSWWHTDFSRSFWGLLFVCYPQMEQIGEVNHSKDPLGIYFY